MSNPDNTEPFRILALDGISPRGVALLRENPRFHVDESPAIKDEAEVATKVASYDGVLLRSGTQMKASAFHPASKVKVIGRAGVGVDNIDADAATENGVVVMNTPGGNTISTAEHTFSLMSSLARNIPHAHMSMANGAWDRKKYLGVELNNKTLGIVGMGRIGGEVARRAIAFGMRVLAYDPYLAVSRARSLQVELLDELPELLSQADFITLHMPLTPETTGIINEKSLGQCKKGVRIINCARGPLVVEKDLVAALESGHVAGAALDVYESEPPAEDNPLRNRPDVVLTPHLGASTEEAQENVGLEVAEQVRDFLLDGIIRNAVNMPSVDTKTLAQIRPHLTLADKLGRLLSQLGPKRVERLEISYAGAVNDTNTTPVTRALVKGFLTIAHGPDAVNDVNAMRLAASQGIQVDESKSGDSCDYNELITARAIAGDEKREVSATFFGPFPRIVRIDGFHLEAEPSGFLAVMENKDRPGIIGEVGTTLAKYKINIASMSLSRTEPGSRALSLFNIDSAPDEACLAELEQDEDIYSIKIVEL